MIHTITIITCTTNCMLSISCKSSTICSSSGILIINNGGNVLPIEFALAKRNARITRVHSYKCHKHSLHCLLVSYKEYDQCYHKYNVTCKGHTGEYDQQDLPHLCIFLRFKNCNVLHINHMYQYVL